MAGAVRLFGERENMARDVIDDEEDVEEKEPPKAEETEKPEPPRLQPIQRPWRATAIALVGLFVLAVFYTFYFAREIFLPITLAWILNLLLRPILNFLKRCHI